MSNYDWPREGWLDRVVEEQRRLQGAAIDLIDEVAGGPLPVGEELDQWERDAAQAARFLIEEAKGEGDLDGSV